MLVSAQFAATEWCCLCVTRAACGAGGACCTRTAASPRSAWRAGSSPSRVRAMSTAHASSGVASMCASIQRTDACSLLACVEALVEARECGVFHPRLKNVGKYDASARTRPYMTCQRAALGRPSPRPCEWGATSASCTWAALSAPALQHTPARARRSCRAAAAAPAAHTPPPRPACLPASRPSARLPALPMHLPQLIPAIQHYHWVLKTCHSGAELDTALTCAQGFVDPDLRCDGARIARALRAHCAVMRAACMCCVEALHLCCGVRPCIVLPRQRRRRRRLLPLAGMPCPYCARAASRMAARAAALHLQVAPARPAGQPQRLVGARQDAGAAAPPEALLAGGQVQGRRPPCPCVRMPTGARPPAAATACSCCLDAAPAPRRAQPCASHTLVTPYLLTPNCPSHHQHPHRRPAAAVTCCCLTLHSSRGCACWWSARTSAA